MAKRKAPEDLKPRKYPKIYPGHRFGRLTVVAECQTPDSSHRKSKDYNRYFFCQCECGEGAIPSIQLIELTITGITNRAIAAGR